MGSSNPATDLTVYLTVLLPQIPVLLVFIVGMILALVFRQKHPLVSLLAILAFGLHFLNGFIGSCLTLWVQMNRDNWALTNAEIGYRLTMIAYCRSAVSVIAWVLVLFAVFGWRKAPVPARLDTAAPRESADPQTGIQVERF